MHPDLQAALEGGATVLTGSHRLARSLMQAFTAGQRNKARSVWSTPKIQSLDAFLQASWTQAILQGDSDGRALLNEAQEAALWENVIWDSPSGRTLLRVAETARRSMDAWQLIHAYRLPLRSAEFAASEDCEAFSGWAAEFQKRLDARGFLDSARLPDHVGDLFRAGRLTPPHPLWLAGFDDWTPQQSRLLDALPGATLWTRPPCAAVPRAAGFADSAEELRQAAFWARAILQAEPRAKIGVVVPALENLRSKVDRLFSEALHPAAEFHSSGAAFHISVGPELSTRPIVHAALLILERAGGPLAPELLGSLVRSPYLKGAEEERSARAVYDAALRRKGSSAAAEAACPRLSRAFSALDREARKLPAEQYPSDWARSFSRLLKAAGWPGGVTQTSAEFQTLRAWNGLLSTLASLDPVSGRLSFSTALNKLRKLASSARFQSENAGSPVEIVGLLEATGLQFDHLWVSGLHHEAMPPAARPNPFVPLALQRLHDVPHSSAARELQFNGKLLARLVAGAPDVVLSYPCWEGDQPLGPSPLIARFADAAPRTQETPAFPAPSSWAESIHASALSEVFEDSFAPPLEEGSSHGGGTWLLRDMAACSFRAYAQHRLGARQLEEPELGVTPRERGKAVHEALQWIWSDLRTHAALVAMPRSDLQALIDACVERALDGRPGLGRTLEKVRLKRLLHDWMAVEKARPPFEVVGFEEETNVTVGGLRISTRIDRIDRLPDGRHVILDYKTGDVKPGAWLGDRPDEPQVPLYCATSQRPIAAAAFAQIGADTLRFRGLAEHDELGKILPMKAEHSFGLAGTMRAWDRALHALAARFRSGAAHVDPKSKLSCQYCRHTSLCRIRDDHQAAEAPEE